MSFKTLKVVVEFDMVVPEERFDVTRTNLGYELVHKIRFALTESKDYLISMPAVFIQSEPK